MKYWTIKAFTTNRGVNVIKEWLKGQPRGAQVEIDVRLRYLQTQKHWVRPYAAKRKGPRNIFEVRIKWGGVQYRPLGFYGPNPREFTLLIGAQEKDRKLVPITADKIADTRRKLVLEDERYAVKYFKNDL